MQGMRKWGWETSHVIDAAASGRPLLVADWLADQEVGLLDGILHYGFGNWRAVAEHMGDDKTEQSCEEHYTRFYLRSKAFPLPNISGQSRPVTPTPGTAACGENHGAPKPSTMSSYMKQDVQRRGASGLILDGQRLAPADLVGYMPLRGEYDTGARSRRISNREDCGLPCFWAAKGYGHADGSNLMCCATEWDNDAELQICDVEIMEAESGDVLQLKLALLDTYNRQLDERQCRHDFITKHSVQERMARHHAMDRRLSRGERQFRTRMRPYAQHTLPDEHEVLTRAMIRERDLRRRLDHLNGCARTGIARLSEAEGLWRIALAQEDPHLKRDAPISRSVLGSTATPAVATPAPPPAAGPVSTGTGAASCDSTFCCPEPRGPAGAFGGAAAVPPSAPGAVSASVAVPQSLTASLASVRATAAASSAGIDGVPGCVQAQNRLSASEVKACLSMGFTASQYVACKRALILSVAKLASSPLSTIQADAPLRPRLEQHRIQQLHAYILRNGWMSCVSRL